MTYTVECFDLGFICESVFRSANRGEVLDQVLVHVDEQHGTGASSASSGFRDFVGHHISQVEEEATPESWSGPSGHRRATGRAGQLTTRIAAQLVRRGSQPNHVEEPTR
jgi:predicted small metal-binding protein